MNPQWNDDPKGRRVADDKGTNIWKHDQFDCLLKVLRVLNIGSSEHGTDHYWALSKWTMEKTDMKEKEISEKRMKVKWLLIEKIWVLYKKELADTLMFQQINGKWMSRNY